MFQRISNSWDLVKASGAVLMADKELIVYPVISSISLIIVTILFIFPFFFSGLLDSFTGGIGLFGYLFLFLFYVVQYFVIIFFNTALISAALIRLKGGDPTVRDGFNAAIGRLRTILGYALISATVGLILRAIAERSNFLGQIVVSLIGLAWNLATFLAIPILVVEDVGPWEAIKRSSSLLKRSWGEQIVGNLSISLIFGLLAFVVILIDILLAVLFIVLNAPLLTVIPLVISLPVLVALTFISSSLSGIFSAAVYQYAIGEGSDQFFPEDMVAGAFRPR